MSKRLLSAALIAGLGLAFAPGANAADGTINFNGRVLAQSCQITNDGQTVNLPWVYMPALDAAGKTTGAKTFTIDINGCDKALTKAQAYFSGGSRDMTSGNLLQTATTGAATNVEIQLLNGDGTVISVKGADAAAQNSKQITMNADGSVSLPFQARYIAVGGAATAGQVTSDVQFTMVYQ